MDGVDGLTTGQGCLSVGKTLSVAETIALTVTSNVLAVKAVIVVAVTVQGTIASLAVTSGVKVILGTSVLRSWLRNGVGLALDLGRRRNISALLGRTNREDRALPLVTLASKLLVLGSLGADTAGKVNVGENAVLLGDSDVGLLVSSNRLSLLLVLGELLLGSVVVTVVNVGSLLRVVLSLSGGTISLLLDLEEQLIKLVALILNSLLNSLLQRRADNLQHERLEDREEKLVVGLLHLNLKLGKVNIDLLNLEVVLTILLVGSRHLHLEREAVAREDDVSNTSVHLDTGNLDLHGLVALVGNLLAAPAEVVLAGDLENVRSEVVTLKNKVLNDGIELRIGVLNSRDGDVSNVLEGSRKDDIPQVLEQMRLEDRLTILVVAKILEQLLERLGKGMVLSVLIELVGKELDLIDDTVGVASVLVTEEVSALVVQLIPLASGLILKDVTLLKEASADVRVHGLEPVLELAVVISIAVDLADSLPEVLGGGTIGETLNDGAEVTLGGVETTAGILSSLGRSLANSAGVTAVGLGQAEESLNGFGVILVLLALKNHLLETPDGLLLALLGHLLVEVVASLVAVLLVLLKDALLGLGINLVVKLVLGSLNSSVLASLRIGLTSGVTGLIGGSGNTRALLVLLSGGSAVNASGSNVLSILLGVSTVDALGLVLEVLLGEVRSLVPDVVLSRLIELLKLLLRRSDLGSSVGSSITSHIAEKNSSIREKLSELSVSDEQLAKGPQALKSLVTILLGSVLADRRVGGVDALGIELGGLPDKVLDQVALVLGEKEMLGLLDSIGGILNQLLTIG
ncbi:hypothetical protein HG530_005983 [Fusarium avenaceum]|nr:hypothetical protein HG530_005983 [Fusarium avenaceum]